MCGIVGYIGSSECSPIVLQGLSRLEYRGYDSAGLAVHHGGAIHCVRAEGRLARLEPLLGRLPQGAAMGMGHTRWATHGKPSTENAHPHSVPELALVHNGIIENYAELKKGLRDLGVVFQSDTDTEVALHLLARAWRETQDPLKAIRLTLPKLEGAYAFGLMFAADPDALYLVKNGAPAVVGLGKGENFFASDGTALADRTSRVVFLEDGDVARVGRESLSIFGVGNQLVTRAVTQLSITPGSLEKRGYRHFMLKEIHEQPAVMSQILSSYCDRRSGALNEDALGLGKVDLARIDRIIFVACGTAYHAGYLGRYLLEPLLKIPVLADLASEFRYRHPYLRASDLVVAVSQSGETADTLASIKHAKSAGCQTLALCNAPYSSIVRECLGTMFLHAGPEIGVASTKAFTAMVLAIEVLGLALARARGTLKPDALRERLEAMDRLPQWVEQALMLEPQVEALAARFDEAAHFLYIGRGVQHAVAMEGALKLKEISYIHAEAYAGGELKHGPIALVDRHMPIVALVPPDDIFDKMISNVEEVRAREGRIIAMGRAHDPRLSTLGEEFLPLPDVRGDAARAIVYSIPLQLLSYHIAVRRGTDVDQPRNLAKSVTVE